MGFRSKINTPLQTGMSGDVFDDILRRITATLENTANRTSEETRLAGGSEFFGKRIYTGLRWLSIMREAGLNADQEKRIDAVLAMAMPMVLRCGAFVGGDMAEPLTAFGGALSEETNKWVRAELTKRIPRDIVQEEIARMQREREAEHLEHVAAEIEKQYRELNSIPEKAQRLREEAALLRSN